MIDRPTFDSYLLETTEPERFLTAAGARVSLKEGPVTLLVVDDDEPIRNAVRRYLAQQGYEVTLAATGEEALGVLRRQKIMVMVLDVNLPGVSGIDLVPRIIEIEPSIALIMLTGVNDATTAALCMQRGAMEYLIKPIALADLGRAVGVALQRRRSLIESRRISHRLQEGVEQPDQERLAVATLEAVVNALEARDPYLRGHSARVADLSAMVADHLGCPDDVVEAVRTAGRLHDIGKIGIREDLLNKQGPLTDEEYEHVKQHAVVGSQILAPLVHLHDTVTYVRNHHERWDGYGYPDGLAGDAIPLGARIIGAVEIYDALTTARPYQEKMPPEAAIERLRDLVGTVIDPSIHGALDAVITRRQALVFLDDPEA